MVVFGFWAVGYRKKKKWRGYFEGELALQNVPKWAEFTKKVSTGFCQLVSGHRQAQFALLSSMLA